MPKQSSYNFFKNFPKIQYNEKLAVDLLTNVKVTREKFQTALKLEPFVVSDDDTLDGLAHWIYKDPFLFYILALLNDIEDPFNDWVCNMLELNRIVINKYQKIFLNRHKQRVLDQIHQFFFDEQRFYFNKSLTRGRYYVKLFFKDRTSFGKIKFTITDNEKIKEELKEKTDIYSNAAIQYGATESQSFLDLTSDSSYTTKIFVEEGSNNVKIDLYLAEFTPFTFEALIPYEESLTTPTTKEYFLNKGKELVLEFNNEFELADLLFYGSGGDLVVELYNASYLLVHRTFTYKFMSFKDFISAFNGFLAKPKEKYENIELYAYSNKLIHDITSDIYEKQKVTNFLNFSIKTIEEFLREKYEQNFFPKMYDIMSDYYNERVNSEGITSKELNESFTKVKCASTRGVDLTKKDTKTIDGVILSSGNVVLLKDQKNRKENGLYKYDETFSLMRMKTFNYFPLMTVFVEQGAKNASTEWMLTNRDNVIEGSELLFSQVYGVIFEQNSVLKNLRKFQGLIEPEEYHYYAQDIYNDTHHWETSEESVMGGGVEVEESYSEKNLGEKSRVRVTNFEYETKENDKKRNIFVLHPTSSEMFITAFNNLLGVR